MAKTEHIAATYKWDASNCVQEMETEITGHGNLNILIYPSNHSGKGMVSTLLKELGPLSPRDPYIVVHNGRTAIMVPEVKAVKDIASLTAEERAIGVLNACKAVSGKPVEMIPTPVVELTGKEKLKADMMCNGGKVGLIGHVALMAKGLKEGRLDVFGTGLGILNPMTMAVLGNGDHDGKYERMVSRMQKHLAVNNLIDAEGLNIQGETGFLNGVKHFIEENPQFIGFGLGNLGAASMLYNSFQPGNKSPLLDRAISITSLVGNAVVMLVPEKKFPKNYDRAKLKEEPIRWLSEFIQENPLKFNGYFNLTDNICWGKKTYDTVWAEGANPLLHPKSDWNKWNKDTDTFTKANTALTALSFGISTFMVSFLGSKEQPEEERLKQYDKVYDLAANILKDVPLDKREMVVDQMTGFLAADPVMVNAGIEMDDIMNGLRSRLQLFDNTPWLDGHAGVVSSNVNDNVPGTTVQEFTKELQKREMLNKQRDSLEKLLDSKAEMPPEWAAKTMHEKELSSIGAAVPAMG